MRHKTFVSLLTIGLLLITSTYAASDYPPEIQALLDKEMTVAQLTAAEKAAVSGYLDRLNTRQSPGTDEILGPDGWYIAKDPVSGGQPFNWVDISATGTELWAGVTADDNWSDPIALPFTFPFYDLSVTSIRISANMILALSTNNPSYSTAVPSPSQPARIDPWCYDMYHLATSHYYYQGFGDSLFVVSFVNAAYYNSSYRNDPTYAKDLQILFWSDGTIKFQYDTLRNILAGSPYASGIDDDNGPAGLSCGNAFTDGLAITFERLTGLILGNGMVDPLAGNPTIQFNYSVLYRHSDNIAPTTANVYIDNVAYPLVNPGGNYVAGVTMTYSTQLDTGTHEFYFTAAAGNDSARLPETGSYPGPAVMTALSGSYDVGGGANHFPNIVTAGAAITGPGIAGPVTFNVYPGTYDGQVLLDNIPGSSAANTVTFQGVHSPTEQMPIVTNLTGGSGTYDGNGFLLRNVFYVTIKGFEFQSCGYCGVQTYSGASTSDSCGYITIDGNYFNQTSSYMMHTYRTHHSVISNNEFNATGSYGCRIRYTTDSEVYNNMSYGATSYGYYTYNSARTEYYYNSGYSTGTRTFYLGGSSATGCTLKNNVFYNAGTGSGYAAYYYTNTGPISDYNCFWAPGNNVGYYGSACQTLSLFQAATGQDANSIEADPLWVSLTDLHITDNSPCIGVGTPIAGITEDIDGDPRDANTPCMGCDEIAGGLRVTLTPHNPPIQIPAGGGQFIFDAEIHNAGDSAARFDGWTEVVLPNGAIFGPLVLRTNLPIAPGQTIMRIVTQNVPGNAPPGNYTYVGNAGTHPGTVEDCDTFPFSKIAGDSPPNHNQGWVVYGWFGDEAALSSVPTEFILGDANPNPFNPTTKISFTLPIAGKALLKVFDVTGREVATLVNGELPMGRHDVVFDGEGLASGIYFYKLTADGLSDAKKMALVK